MAGFLSDMMAGVSQQIERHKNRPFMEATMAAAALVAMADGVISFSERARLDQIFETLGELQVYDVHEEVDLFNAHADALRTSGSRGRDAALAVIGRIAHNPAAAKLLVKICIAVAHADGEFSGTERDQIVEICGVLGLSPDEFEL